MEAFIFLALVLMYFLPFAVAMLRRHHNSLAIFMLNFFLGWTGLGWIVALVWSCTSTTKGDQS